MHIYTSHTCEINNTHYIWEKICSLSYIICILFKYKFSFILTFLCIPCIVLICAYVVITNQILNGIKVKKMFHGIDPIIFYDCRDWTSLITDWILALHSSRYVCGQSYLVGRFARLNYYETIPSFLAHNLKEKSHPCVTNYIIIGSDVTMIDSSVSWCEYSDDLFQILKLILV